MAQQRHHESHSQHCLHASCHLDVRSSHTVSCATLLSHCCCVDHEDGSWNEQSTSGASEQACSTWCEYLATRHSTDEPVTPSRCKTSVRSQHLHQTLAASIGCGGWSTPPAPVLLSLFFPSFLPCFFCFVAESAAPLAVAVAFEADSTRSCCSCWCP